MQQPSVQVSVYQQHFSKADEGQIFAVAFEVSQVIEALDVVWTMISGEGEGAVIDLGLADPMRVRGWSGGARRAYHVDTQQATPGYLPGALPAGKWGVLLGAYAIPEAGCSVEVTVTQTLARSRWLKGDLHVHTFHSDGTYSPDETARMVEAIGLDFVALTDHNTASQNLHFPASEQILFIPGMELTTYHGHANLLGVADPVLDFRVHSEDDVRLRFAQAHEAGARVMLNHPHDASYAGCDWGYSLDIDYDWLEVWNGPWRPCNQTTLTWWQTQLVAGRRIVAVGGSDLHGPHPYVRHGMPTTWVYATARSVDAILDAIDRGHAFMSVSPAGPVIDLHAGQWMMGDEVSFGAADLVHARVSAMQSGDVIRLLTDQGIVQERTVQPGEDRCELSLQVAAHRFCRLEVWRFFPEVKQTLIAALSNPIYFH